MLLALGSSLGPQSAQAQTSGEGKTAHQPTDLVLEAPITSWDEALPLGNGLTGGLLWGEGRTLRLSLDRGDLWDERMPATYQQDDWTYATMRRLVRAGRQEEIVSRFGAPYNEVPYPTKLPGGRLEITLDSSQHVRSFRMDLSEATAQVDLESGQFTGFFSATQPVALFRLTGGPPEAVRLVPPAAVETLGYPVAQRGQEDDGRWFVQEAAQGLSYAVVVEVRCIEETSGREITLLAVAVTSTRDADDPLALGRSRVRSALNDGYDRLHVPHKRWWADFWATSRVEVPSADVQQHYDLVKYFYGAASRPEAPPMPLQGVWTADNGSLPPWKGDYHNDLNTQMTYLPYHVAGLTDAGQSFIDFNWKLLPQYQAFAWSFYGVPGAVIPGVMSLSGQPMGGWPQYSLSPTNGAWVAQSFYLHWRYTQDEAFLRQRAYPFGRAIGTALEALLEPDSEGLLKLPLSSSPEIHDNRIEAWLPPNSNYDQALLKWLYGALEEMARASGYEQEAQAWKAVQQRLEPFDLDEEQALTFAKGDPYRTSHRHFSHAMAIHPLGLLTVEGGPEERRIIEATLDRALDEGTSQWVGYSFSWMASLLARAGRAEEALAYLTNYVDAFILRNGFHVNGDQSGQGLSDFTYRPFTLEGNFLAMEAVHEMLLQSWGDVVRVFPAVSETWQAVSFEELRAQGGYRISARREAGATREVRVEATANGRLRLRIPFGGTGAAWHLNGQPAGDEIDTEDGNYVVQLTAGDVLVGRWR